MNARDNARDNAGDNAGDNNTVPGSPAAEELVPSRYALRVGGIDVLVVSDGVLPLPAATMATNADAAALAVWLDPVPDVLRSTARQFMERYRAHLHLFEERREVAPGVVARRTGGHTPGHCVVDIDSNGERLTFAGDAMFPVGFAHPDWHNGFEHDPAESARVRLALFGELADNGGLLAATHLPLPSVGRVGRDGDTFRWAPVFWDH